MNRQEPRAEVGDTFVQPPVMMNREAYEGVTDLGDFETVESPSPRRFNL